MPFVLGIDAGGTKTVGLLADESGVIVAEARAGGANLFTHGELAVENAFYEIISALSERGDVSAVCVGSAGVDRPRDAEVVESILRRLGLRAPARVVNDAVIALVAGAHERYGIVILAGTGSIAYGVDRGGRLARSGGYGWLLADEGSGYWLGHQVLRAVVRALDGRGARTLLQDLLFEELGISSIEELIPRVYEGPMPKDQIAALAALVERARAQGDVIAIEILQQGAEELCLAARSVALQLSLRDALTVVLAGGVFKACPTLAQAMEGTLQVPGARIHVLDVEPAFGAVLLALELLKAGDA